MSRYWAVVCKGCGQTILDEAYTGLGVVAYRKDDPIKCPVCGHAEKYDGRDFMPVEGPDVAPA